MNSNRVKAGVFLLEGLNSFSVTLYLYYLYFFTQAKFEFASRKNLVLAATIGFVYIFASVFGGRFGQRQGYFSALRVGLSIMATALLVGLFVENVATHVIVLLVYTAGTCFTWPALEALVSENESPLRLQQRIGVYNLVWAATGALAYFSGGAMIERFGLKVLFSVPLAVHVAELGLTQWLEAKANSRASPVGSSHLAPVALAEIPLNPRPIARVKTFLRLAWLANPLAYIAINTVIPTIPALAKRLELSPKFAGFFCSAWLFARTAAFLLLWLWPGWHYRFRWLAGAYLAMLACFTLMLSASDLWLLVSAQIFFGAAIGLIYYSSLYYSMDVSEAKGEHGGIHEAAIGAGNFIGPALGAAALYFFPEQRNSGTWTVSGLLLLGFFTLVAVRSRGRIRV
ncbi:MAG TPA: MFS transporter [Verrucomicrobiae bacterium]|nr:MFS transporter [Verrucomicrobiae bacterium]